MKKQYLVHIDELSTKYKNLYPDIIEQLTTKLYYIKYKLKKILNDSIKPICINKAEWYILKLGRILPKSIFIPQKVHILLIIFKDMKNKFPQNESITTDL